MPAYIPVTVLVPGPTGGSGVGPLNLDMYNKLFALIYIRDWESTLVLDKSFLAKSYERVTSLSAR